MAPPGRSRRDLAQALASLNGGECRRIFHPQSEPSEVPGRSVFHNLTLGYRVTDHAGQWVASCVDDLTLQHNLVRSAPPLEGWYRIASDDRRLLSLVAEHADASSPVEEVLGPIASLFGTSVIEGPGGMRKVQDRSGASIAIAAPLPGERERPCELVTAPLQSETAAPILHRYLCKAMELGFGAPREGATHLHFDAAPFQSAAHLRALVLMLAEHGEELKVRMGCNPHCQRLGPWPSALLEMVREPEFSRLSWQQACAQVLATGLSKYCDYNLLNAVGGHPDLCTVEVRVLPVYLNAADILSAVDIFEELLTRVLRSVDESEVRKELPA